MIATDEASFICDMAQFYHVLDYRSVPVRTLAVLACGLPEESRMIRILVDQKFDIKTMLLANILDFLMILTWFQTKDGHKGRNRPKSIVKILTGKKEESQEQTFNSPEEFELARQRILAKGA